MPARVALVVTSHGRHDESGRMTGLWFSELSQVYDECLRVGVEPAIVSIGGGRVPLDPRSGRALSKEVKARYDDAGFQRLIEGTRPVSSIDPDAIDALYLAGGHGAVYDFADSAALALLVSDVVAAGKPLAAVCHGTAGLLQATGRDGGPLVLGRRLTGFSWREEGLLGMRKIVPFNLEGRLRAAGAIFQPARVPLRRHVVVDGSLITGANPASAPGVGRALLKIAAARR